jgi:hypothetical protein
MMTDDGLQTRLQATIVVLCSMVAVGSMAAGGEGGLRRTSSPVSTTLPSLESK